MDQIIEEKGLKVCIKDSFGDRAGLQNKEVQPGDVVLLFDESGKGPDTVARAWAIPRDQILSLW